MPWTWVLDQRRVVEALGRGLAADRVAHAYLFHGPEGVGKRAAALALAQALECERRGPGGADACGACPPCQKTARLIHPDVHLYLPQPKDADAEDVAERLARLAENPYAEVDFRRRPTLDDPAKASNKQAIYTVDRVREITRDLRYRPSEGRYKVAVLTDADTMNEASANAFLKGLEEPGPRTVLVLTAARPDRLLPTILSRCQRLRFDALPADVIEAALVEREGMAPEEAALLARMADGSYTRALALAESADLAARRQLVLDYFRAAFTGNADRLSDLVEEAAKVGREGLKDVLALMLRWVRDLVLVRTLGPEAPVVNVDQREAVRRFVDHLPDARLDAMAALVEEARELVERNVNATLVLTVLADALRAAMRGRDRHRLFRPLDEPVAA
ncbi:MAG: DNA polymerase III subunit delta' [Rhodothermales bacterium]|nr:DNA polymerase III subunit delta' [Rhodothermales bacterium]